MRTLVLHELQRYPEDAASITVSAHGHVPEAEQGGERSLTISITGKVAAQTKPDADIASDEEITEL